jgi:hypothetical protein
LADSACTPEVSRCLEEGQTAEMGSHSVDYSP